MEIDFISRFNDDRQNEEEKLCIFIDGENRSGMNFTAPHEFKCYFYQGGVAFVYIFMYLFVDSGYQLTIISTRLTNPILMHMYVTV